MLAQCNAGVDFTDEQRAFLDKIKDHLAASLEVTQTDLTGGHFPSLGGLSRAKALFGERLQPLLVELSNELAA